MGLGAIFLMAVGLSMDAFAVAVCKGLALKESKVINGIIVGLWFGIFQALMPLIGYFLGARFRHQITSIDHWIAFVLLGLIGGNMIREALKSGDSCDANRSLKPKDMFPLAVATSIDALAVGITLAFFHVNVVLAVSVIGVTTFILSFLGVSIGHKFGYKYKSKAELAGGAILILLGTKILLEHLGVF